MNDIQKMFQTIINNQSAFRQEVLSRIDKLEDRLVKKVKRLDGEIQKLRKDLTERMDKLGKQLAYLEDDAPTREVFGKLEKRVDKIESKASSL